MQLTGTGFILRQWLPGDEESLQCHANDPNVSQYLLNRFPYPYTLKDAEEWIAFQKNAQGPLLNFAIVVQNKAVGGIAIEMRDDVYLKTPRIGYWLGEQFWGQGIMSEALQLITNYAFENLDVICVQAIVFGDNVASMHILEKSGYEKQGVLRRSVIKNDKIHDEHIYAIYPPKV